MMNERTREMERGKEETKESERGVLFFIPNGLIIRKFYLNL